MGDVIVVGGKFRNAMSRSGELVPRKNLAAFSMTNGALLRDWKVNAGSTVRAMVSDGTSVWVGGNFGRLNGRVHKRIGRIDVGSGSVVGAFDASLDKAVRALELDGSDLYVGGAFTTVNGTSHTRLAKLTAGTGSTVGGFRASADGDVWALAKAPGSPLYAAGRFSTLSGVSRNGVGAVTAGDGTATGPRFTSSSRPTLGLDVNEDGSQLFGAGGAAANTVSAWDTSTGSRDWRVVTMGDNQAIKYYSGTVYFGFHDGYQQDTGLKLLAADSTTGSVDATFRPRFNKFWGVFAIDVSSRGLVAGGDFTRVSTVWSRGWVRFR